MWGGGGGGEVGYRSPERFSEFSDFFCDVEI